VTPKQRTVAPLLFTIGYEQHRTPESLAAVLTEAGVERLLDVRELPISRRRGFAKTALREAVEAAGVAYEHERALGNPKPYRDLYRAGRQEDGERRYLVHIRNGSSWAVDHLGETLTARPTCLLCFEADHRACHRSLLVQELRERLPALRVEHL
jgi:uncharacterized protein (DUF488 family)